MSGVRGLRAQRWPGCFVHCYEPLPDNFALLKRNLRQFEGRSVSLHSCGRRSEPDVRGGELLRYRRTVDGYRRGRDEGARGSNAQIVKIDTEGSEVDILSRDHAGISFRDKSAN